MELMPGPQLSQNQHEIVMALRSSGVPVTVKTLVQMTGQSDQGIRNQMEFLIHNGYVVEVPSHQRSKMYMDAAGKSGKPALFVNGKYHVLEEMLLEYSTNGLPKNAYERLLAGAIVQLYTWAINSIDETNPEPVSLVEMRRMSNRLMEGANRLKDTMKLLEALVQHNGLWNPRDLPKVLILRNNLTNPEEIKDMLYHIEENKKA